MAKAIVVTTALFIERSQKTHGDRYDYSLVNYISQHTKIKIICSIHGIFEQRPVVHYKYNCPKCGKVESDKKHYKHGYNTKDKLYAIWTGLKNRCYNKKNKGYENYGGRGITVCDRWLGANGFINFLEDMHPRISPKHSIDRMNNNGNYEPGNCRWATGVEQQNNRRYRLKTKSGIKNISWNNTEEKWAVMRHKEGKLIRGGMFKTIEEAKVGLSKLNKLLGYE